MLTKARRRVLELALADGGSLLIGGLDGRKVRGDVLNALIDTGMLVFDVNGGIFNFTSAYRITDAGRTALGKL